MLLHHKDSKPTEHCRNDQCFITVHPSKILNHGIFRNDSHTPGNHHRSQHETEQNISALELIFTQYKSTNRTGINHNQRNHQCNHQTIQEEPHKIKMRIHIHVVGRNKLLWKQMLFQSHNFFILLERR